MKAIAALSFAACLAIANGVSAKPQPLDTVTPSAVESPAPEPTVELASYFTFMRSMGRICYSYAVGYHYC